MTTATIKNRVTNYLTNERVVVRDFSDSVLGSRLMSMGILPGSSITIERIAPFKGGYCLKTLSGAKFALRFKEAQTIIVD